MEHPKVWMEVAGLVAVITIDNPPVNSISAQVIRELYERFQEAHKRADVKAIVLTGARNKFSGGADIKSMSGGKEKTPETFALNLVNSVIEGGPKPVVAAIEGFALGGGLELAMACHARVAASGSRLGLPELQLGIFPGLGGTQRLPRLVGVEKAVTMMLTVQMISAAEGHKHGLVDVVCSPSEVLNRSRSYALGIISGKYAFSKTLDRTDKLGSPTQALEVIASARRNAKKTFKHVDYPFVCLDIIEHGIVHGGASGTVLERKLGIQIVETLPAKALMHVFLAERAVYKVSSVTDTQLKARPIKTVGVIGGGLMGSGIATALILRNINVRLKEVDENRLHAALQTVKGNLASRLKKGSLSEEQFHKAMNRLVGCLNYSGFETLSLVIEAVVESIPLKKQIFKEIDNVCTRDCIFASNTSSCDLSVITEGVSFPDRVIGAHFFSPAHVMRLLEIVRTEKTSHQSICDLLALSKTMNKVPVVVRNTPGFAVNRVFAPYSRMSTFLVDLGLHPYRIDAVIKDFGMPMGPFRMGDMAGLQIGTFVSQVFQAEFGDRLYSSQLGSLLVKAGRIGQAVGKGYYNYQGTRQELDAPELEQFLEQSRSHAGLREKGMSVEDITDKDIVEMIFFPIVNEACRVVDEGIVIRASDLDIATVLGMGFPAFRGGLLFWAETVKLNYILSKLQQWEARYGPYFRPTPALHKFVACKTKLNGVASARL